MQSKEKFPSSHTPFRFLAFCSTAITERERNRPVKKCKLREDQSIIIFCSCHTSSIYPCVDAMDSDAKWQIGRREAKKKEASKRKKKSEKKAAKKAKKEKEEKEAKELKQAKGASAGFIGRRVFGIAFGTALLAGLPFGFDLGLKPFPASKRAKHYTIIDCAHNISGESLAGGIPAGGVGTLQTWNWDRQPVMPIMPVMSAMAMSWFLMQVSETERTHENACSVMNLTAGASQSTKNVFRRGAWLRFSPHGKLRSF